MVDDVVLEVRNVSQIFGGEQDRQRVFQMIKDGAPQKDILAETGALVAVRDASFAVRRGEFFVIMGLSGSGKSTLVRCINRLVEPSAGEILINGQDILRLNVNKLRNVRRHLTAMVFQHYGLLPHRTVLENVEYGLKVRGMSLHERRERAMQAIERVGLQGWEQYRPSALSGGMQQRVGVARALAHEPEILLMDEPFSGLDPLIRRQMQEEFGQLHGETKHTTLLVTHDLDEALTLADRIAIMRDGQIVQIATPEELVVHPVDAYVESFVEGASPAKVLTVQHIMDAEVITVTEGLESLEPIIQAVEAQRERGSFVVDHNNKLCGRVWLSALVESHLNHEQRPKWVNSIEPAVATRPGASLADVFPLVIQTRFPVAVVDSQGKLLGQVTKNKLLQTLMHDVEHGNVVDREAELLPDEVGSAAF